MGNNEWLEVAPQIEEHMKAIMEIAKISGIRDINIYVSGYSESATAKTFIDDTSHYIGICKGKTLIEVTRMGSNGYRTEILN